MSTTSATEANHSEAASCELEEADEMGKHVVWWCCCCCSRTRCRRRCDSPCPMQRWPGLGRLRARSLGVFAQLPRMRNSHSADSSRRSGSCACDDQTWLRWTARQVGLESQPTITTPRLCPSARATTAQKGEGGHGQQTAGSFVRELERGSRTVLRPCA